MIAGAIFAAVLTLLLILRPLVRRYARRTRNTERREFLEIPMQVLSRTTFAFLRCRCISRCVRSTSVRR